MLTVLPSGETERELAEPVKVESIEIEIELENQQSPKLIIE